MVPKLIVIVGETASGKSELGLRAAEHMHGEIVSADSWTVYRGFNIGTAKPSPEEQARVPHHLIDIADPREGFSAALFKGLAEQAITDIAARDKLPFLVGGTGLYIDSVLYNYEFLPAPSPGQREELNGLSLPKLLERAEAMGLSTDMIDTRNKRRVIRLIENNGRQPGRGMLRSDTLLIGLRIPREQLEVRIEQRVDAMLAAGLEEETRQLADIYGWDVEPMKGIGYREWRAYFAGEQPLEATREQIVRSTLQLAKKQRTWFKREPAIKWFEDAAKALEFIKSQV
jgi:tRNA dimethylallyltransferase